MSSEVALEIPDTDHPRIYRSGDNEPHDECVVLLENGWLAQRIGERWVCGFVRFDWADMLHGDMLAVGVDLPTHPDPLAVPPSSLIAQPVEPACPSPLRLVTDPMIPRTIGPIKHAPEGVVDVQLPFDDEEAHAASELRGEGKDGDG